MLFSGTPCQVSGLKRYLRKQYDNLFLIDLVCHGIPSPGLWSMYVKYIKGSVKSRLTYVSFRNKRYGYAGSTMALGYENGKPNSLVEGLNSINIFFSGYKLSS